MIFKWSLQLPGDTSKLGMTPGILGIKRKLREQGFLSLFAETVVERIPLLLWPFPQNMPIKTLLIFKNKRADL